MHIPLPESLHDALFRSGEDAPGGDADDGALLCLERSRGVKSPSPWGSTAQRTVSGVQDAGNDGNGGA